MTNNAGRTPSEAELELRSLMSKAIRDFMEERGITQQQVADRLGRSQGYVSQHTNGRSNPGSDIIAAVATLAGLAPRSFMVEVTERMMR
ncbi:helix-turn-helix domain-containing protein [Isoptericola sp. NPDC056134]|uniref:helix-turn-helix domain-containing protein n=1 Tax=Isoptericola sp. NPDC056134 TaxID=3345723 RepID=UPI0035E6D068